MTVKCNPTHLPKTPSYNEKYSYIIKYPLFLKALYIFNIFGLMVMVFGYFYVFSPNLIYGIMITPILSYLICNNFLGIFLNLFYKPFNTTEHENKVQKFWLTNYTRYKINIFLPVCGEGVDILENTWKGVLELQNAKYESIVNVLDDMDQPAVKSLAQKFGFEYIVRPNRGYMKKAGNLKYAFERTDGDFILILDADFRPRFDFILDTLPYMNDPLIAIVQTPQFFDHNQSLHQKSPLESGAGNIQEYFYKIIQVARNRFGGAICVGSCALYRRKALEEIGGTAQVEHSEDVHTGFRLIDRGWKINYIPINLSKGVCPDDMHAFFKQQTRWCQGSMSMMTNPKFWQSRISLMTKLCYISGFMFYIANPLGILLSFQTFILLFFDLSQLSSISYLTFFPMLFGSLLIQGLYVYPNAKLGTLLAQSAAVWFYSYTILGLLFGHTEGWQPSGVKSKLSNGFLTIARISTIYLSLYLFAILASTFFQKINFGDALLFPMTFWISVNIIYHTYFWHNVQDYIKKNQSNNLGLFKVRKLFSQAVILGIITGIIALGFWKSTDIEQSVTTSDIGKPQTPQFTFINQNLFENDNEINTKNKIIDYKINNSKLMDIELRILK
jgi:cellulose synthase (UDP-forming)